MNKFVIFAANIDHFKTVQNRARFFVYGLARYCDKNSSSQAILENGLYKSKYFKKYFLDPARKAYLIKSYDEIAGFILINNVIHFLESDHNIAKFFVTSKF